MGTINKNSRGEGAQHSSTRRVVIFVYVNIALLAGLLVFWATAMYGIGVSSDSAHYLGVARSILEGRGIEFNGAPFTHWPPFYPLLIAAFCLKGADPLSTARWIAIVLFASNVLLAMCAVGASTGRIWLPGATVGLLLVFSPEMVHIHTVAWSEPPFLLFSLLTLLLMARWMSMPRRWLLLPISLSIAMAVLTRFVGISLLGPTLICIGFCRPGSRWQRAREMILVLLVSLAPIAAWLLWIRRSGHSEEDRLLVFHPPISGLTICLMIALLTVALFLLVTTCWNLRVLAFREVPDKGRATLRFWLLWPSVFLVTYISLVLFSICFVDALTPLDARILSPVYLFGLVAVSARIGYRTAFPRKTCSNASNGVLEKSAVDTRNESRDKMDHVAWKYVRQSQQGLLLACALLVCLRAGGAISLAKHRHDEGYGYTGREWRESECLAWLQSQPRERIVYSNCPEAIAFCINRNACLLPIRISPTSLQHNSRVDRDVLALRDKLALGAVVVEFLRSPRFYLVSSADLQREPHVRLIYRLRDGMIYGYAAK